MNNMAEENVFTDAVGDYPITRVLCLLMTGREIEYSISDIADCAQVGWTTLHYILPELEKKELIKHTRDIGRAKMYKINQENLVAQQMILFYDNLLDLSADEIIEKQALKH